jgi:hypothetical protein
MNFLARIINRLGRRWGIRPFPWTNPLSLEVTEGDNKVIFDSIHEANYWGSEESISGGGSTLAWANSYAQKLASLIFERRWTSIFDAPCGDLNWMSALIDQTGITYIGGDVSEHAIQAARLRRPGVDVQLFDIRSDPFPKVDVWHCRDCLFHLSFEDGLAALRNFVRSDVEWALITTHTARWLRNLDIETGGWRLLDLERAPFKLPPPVCRIDDYPKGEDFPRYVGLWRRESIASLAL